MFEALRHYKENRGRLRKMTWAEVGQPHLRANNPIIAGSLDVRVDPITDWFSVADNTPVRAETLFAIQQGQPYTGAGAGNAIIKTPWHTTMTAPGSLPNPEKMLVKAICVQPTSDINPYDANQLVSVYLLTFRCSGKEYATGWAMRFPAGAGAFTSGGIAPGTGVATNTAAFSSGNGWPSDSAISWLTDSVSVPADLVAADAAAGGVGSTVPINGIFIEQGQPFSVIMDPTQTGGTIYTTQNTTTIPGVTGVGIKCQIALLGDHYVAIN
jgi:hypothetical protein